MHILTVNAHTQHLGVKLLKLLDLVAEGRQLSWAHKCVVWSSVYVYVSKLSEAEATKQTQQQRQAQGTCQSTT